MQGYGIDAKIISGSRQTTALGTSAIYIVHPLEALLLLILCNSLFTDKQIEQLRN
jgi:hypothetical protein